MCERLHTSLVVQKMQCRQKTPWHWRLFVCWGGTHTGHSHRKAKGESRLRPSPAKLGWDARAVLASARRIRWSICAPHAGQFDVGVTLFLEVPFRQLWCITSLSRKKCPRLTGPRQAWATTPAGLGMRVLLPGEVLAARIISARTPVRYRRMKTGSRVPDARLMASNFCTRPSRPTIHWRSIGVSSRRLAPPGPPTSEEVGHLLKDGYT